MTRPTRISIAGSALLVVSVVLLGATLIQALQSGGNRDRGEARLGSSSVVAIVDGRAVAPIGKSEFQQTWSFTADAILYERGEYPIRGSSETIDLGSPSGAFVVTTDSRFVLLEGSAYTLVLDAIGTDKGSFPESFDWYAKAVLAGDGEPVAGTPESLAGDLAAIVLPTDRTLKEALVEFAREAENYGRERDALEEAGASPESAIPGARHQAIRDREAAIRDEALQLLVGDYLARRAIDRQLPLDFEEVERMPTAVRDALGMDGFVRWNIEVVYDRATADSVAWYGVLFEGVGLIGPSSSDQGFTSIDGLGPPQGRIRLVTWGHGIPEQAFTGMPRPEPSDGQPIVPGNLHDLGLNPSVRSSIPEDGTLLVRMERGEVVSVEILDGDEYQRFLSSYSGVDSEVPGESG